MGTALVLLGTVLALAGFGGLVYALFAKGRRKKVAKRAAAVVLAGLVVGLVGGGLAGHEQAEERRLAGGFATIEEMEAAEAVGAATKADYLAHLAAVQAAAERRAAEEKSQAEEAARLAAEQAAADEAACRQDLRCWAETWLIDATFPCERLVERFAKFDVEWTDGFLEPKLSRYRWKDRDAGVVTFIGDKVKFQNGFGAWSPMIYECDFDPASESIVDVRIEPGRL